MTQNTILYFLIIANLNLINQQHLKMKKPKKRTLTVSEKQIAYGMFGGLLIGIFTDNIGLWLSLGLVFGASYSSIKKDKKE